MVEIDEQQLSLDVGGIVSFNDGRVIEFYGETGQIREIFLIVKIQKFTGYKSVQK